MTMPAVAELFDADRLQIPELRGRMAGLVLRIAVAAARTDPRGEFEFGRYAWCVPCEIALCNLAKANEVQDSIQAMDRACSRLGFSARAEGRCADSARIGSVNRLVKDIAPFFSEDGFDERSYRRQRHVPGIKHVVTSLRFQLEYPWRLVLEEELSYRPELLQADLHDRFFLWWQKRKHEKRLEDAV